MNFNELFNKQDYEAIGCVEIAILREQYRVYIQRNTEQGRFVGDPMLIKCYGILDRIIEHEFLKVKVNEHDVQKKDAGQIGEGSG